MELTRVDAVFSKIATVLFLCRIKSSRIDLKIHGDKFGIYKKYWRKNRQKGAHTLATRVEGAPPDLVGPLDLHRPQLQLHIFTFGEKKIREKDSSRFMIRSRRHLLFFLGRVD